MIGLAEPGAELTVGDVLISAVLGIVLVGPVVGVIGGLRDGAVPILLCTELALLVRGRPVRFLRLLEAARDRQILRQSGAVYQFRHADLQDQLAARHQH